MTRVDWRRALLTLAGFAFAIAAVALVRHTAHQGQDFTVFWKTAHHVLEGRPAYNLIRDGAMSFKYPPWSIPAFLPLALFSLETAKWLWGFICVAALIYVIRSVIALTGASGKLVAALTAVFWGIWAVHAMDGQITLPLLALCLWSYRRNEPLAAAATVWALSSKVFTVIGATRGLRGGWSISKVLSTAALLLTLSVPALKTANEPTPTALWKSWQETSTSGGWLFEGEKTRGRDNQGLPALSLRLLGVPSKDHRADIAAFVVLALLVGGAWAFASARMPQTDQWFGWLALAAALHPLAWFHQFVLAFPLVVLALHRASGWSEGHRRAAWFAALMIAVITRKTLGPIGEAMELASIKSLGVLVLLWLLSQNARPPVEATGRSQV